MRIKALAILLSGAWIHGGAFAHEGHGLPGSAHWHASDTLGFVGLAVVAVAVWFLHKRK